MKLIRNLFLLAIIIAVAGFFVFFQVGDDGIKVREQNQPLLKKISRYISKIIYDEATKYNPEGDFMPDQIDDMIKEKIKDTVK